MLDLEDCAVEIRMWFCRFFAEIRDECRGKTGASSPRAVNQQIPLTAKISHWRCQNRTSWYATRRCLHRASYT